MARPSFLITIGATAIAGAAFFASVLPQETKLSESDLDILLDPRLIAQNQCGREGQSRAAFFKPSFQLALASAAQASTGNADQVPLWPGLGERSFPVTTASAEAQTYFDQGLALLYGFNHWEAIRSFRKAQALDPSCALCYWGEAKAHGPNINAPMADAAATPANVAIAKAQELAEGAGGTRPAICRCARRSACAVSGRSGYRHALRRSAHGPLALGLLGARLPDAEAAYCKGHCGG